MKLESQVCSLELAQKLKALGVKQESLFVWNARHLWVTLRTDVTAESFLKDLCAAFTVAELWELLLSHVHDLTLSKDDINGNKVEVLPRVGDWTREYDTSPANVLAKMLIYLLENKLISL